MALTEEEKKRIKEERAFRAKISGEISGQKKTSWKIYLITSLIIWAIAILIDRMVLSPSNGNSTAAGNRRLSR